MAQDKLPVINIWYRYHYCRSCLPFIQSLVVTMAMVTVAMVETNG